MSRIAYTKISPQLYNTLYAMEKLLAESPLDKALVDLIKIRASQLNGCLFCLDMHVKEATLHGEKALRLHHIAIWHESSLFTDKERAALEWTEMLTRIGPHGVDDDTYNRIAAQFSEKELSDLTFAVGCINMWNRLGVAFTPEPGSLDQMLGLDKANVA